MKPGKNQFFKPLTSLFRISFLFLAGLCFIANPSFAANSTLTQHLKYTVYVSGSKRGTLQADINRKPDKSFDIRLETKLHFPFTDVVSLIQVHYKAHGLESSSSLKHINDDLKEKITVKRVDGGYALTDVDGKNTQLLGKIPFSVGRLYHDEPVGMKELFSERLGTFVPIRSLKAGEYELLQPDGKKNVFVYRYGICTEMRTEMMACNVRFVLTD